MRLRCIMDSPTAGSATISATSRWPRSLPRGPAIREMRDYAASYPCGGRILSWMLEIRAMVVFLAIFRDVIFLLFLAVTLFVGSILMLMLA